MSYILIEEKAWLELRRLAEIMTAKVRLLERHFYPIDKEGWIDNTAVCK